jgi:hypothetical protein
MSLNLVLNEKTIKNRHKILQQYLQNHSIGTLNENDKQYYKQIFNIFYEPDKEHTKFNISDITDVSVMLDNYKRKYFSICVNNIWYPTAIKRLAGSKRTDKANLIRSMRFAIAPQILKFRQENELHPDNICPIINYVLGNDAQVDHQIPFSVLVNDFLLDNKNIVYKYDLNQQEYILQEPYYTDWYNYHLKRAILRYVSKEGNKTAHKLYSLTLYESKGFLLPLL